MQAPQAGSVAIPKRWPLVTQNSNRNDTFLKDARLVNCFAEKDEATGNYNIYQRVGLSALQYALNGNGRGVYEFQGSVKTEWVRVGNRIFRQFVSNPLMLLIAGTTCYSLTQPSTGSPVLSALYSGMDIGGLCRFCQITLNEGGNTTPALVFGDGSVNPYYYDGTTVTQISAAAQFPANTVPGFALLDGTLYVMDVNGAVWGSGFDGSGNSIIDGTAVWGGLNVILAQIEKDGGVFLAKQLTYVIAIKQWTTEFFYDAGNSVGSPLSPIPGAMLNNGCLNADTVQELDGCLYWVTFNRTNSPQVIKLENLKPRIVSTPAIDRLLDATSLSSAFISFPFKHGGHKFYVLTCIDQNFTIVYDIDQNLWYQWTDANGNYYPITSATFDVYGDHIFQNYITGGIYIADGDYEYPNDSGALFPVDIYTPNFDAGVDRKKMLTVMRFNADQTDGCTLSVRHSDDDYKTWSNFRYVDLSQKRPTLRDEGTFYRRAYHFRKLANTTYRIRSVDLQMGLGTL
jgi:hypothetical protein